MIKLGSHVSFKAPDYLYGAGKESVKNKANTLMIYLGAPQNARRVSTDVYKLNEYLADFGNKISVEDIVIHAPYIVNPSNPEKTDFAKSFLIQEIKRMNYIGCKFLVLHPGASTKFSVDKALDTLINNLKYILDNTKQVEILLETMAGKGTEVGVNYEQLMFVIKKVNNARLGVCLDTCHVWDAGYDITNVEQFMQELKTTKIIDFIRVIHLNDSLNGLSSHKDRHANIGKGHIGTKTLKAIVHRPEFDNIPIILETPWTDDGPIYDQEIELLLN